MIPRFISQKLIEISHYFPILSLTGPRQSGKTTILQHIFPDLPYISLEDPDNYLGAQNDPRTFLRNYEKGAFFDEAQRVPHLFSYLQGIVDKNQDCKFILSGSQNFLMSEKITQSLAGRVGLLTLLPLSYEELTKDGNSFDSYEEILFTGFYPRIHQKKMPPTLFYRAYMQTYIERDVRMMSNIGDLSRFTIFLKLCAGRVGQLLNLSSLANDAGVSVNTAKSWISILQASYILFRLIPHYKNFNKRLVKMPKLYFYDTGLLCYLLDIESPSQLGTHYAKGNIFENYVLAELIKKRFNQGLENNIYFWRDHKGHEIDCIIEKGEKLTPIEIKSGSTKLDGYFKNLIYWNRLSGNSAENSFVVYGGSESLMRSNGQLIAWNELDKIEKK